MRVSQRVRWNRGTFLGVCRVEIGTGQKTATLSSEAALRLIVVTLRAGAIFAGVIGKDFLPTVIALVDMASKERRAASGNIPECSFPVRAEGVAVLFAVGRAVEADDIGHLQHEDLGFRGPSSVR